jgi:hypothetical protein
MPWWETVLFLIAVGVAIWGFISMVGVRTRFLTRKTDRRAEAVRPRARRQLAQRQLESPGG